MSKKTLILITIFILVIVGIIAINSGGNSNSTTSNTLTSQSNFATINNVKDLKTRLDDKNPDDILLDVRTPQEFDQSHIKDAVNLNLKSGIFDSEIKKLDKNKTYLVFCSSGNRALEASQKISAIGLKTIYIKEGMTSWLAGGYETV